MNDLTVSIEFANRQHLLETAISLIGGSLEALTESNSKQFEAINIAFRYLIELRNCKE